MASEVVDLIVMQLPPNDELKSIRPNTEEYTCVASAINISIAMLNNSTCRHHLVDLALSFDGSGRGGHFFHNDRARAETAVDIFLEKIRTSYPAVVIDYTIQSASNIGFHVRRSWSGQLRDFDSRRQMIHLNGARVRDMCNASGQRPKNRFRVFQFMFATCLVHEVGGHMLLTYLSNGGATTPPHISVHGYSTSQFIGESGRYLELKLFGGTSEYFYDSKQDRHQAGDPYQIGASGWAYKIDPVVIDDVCGYRFQFPFQRKGGHIDPNTKVSLGRTFDNPEADPQIRNMIARQGPIEPRAFRSHKVYVQDLMDVPRHPERLLVEAR